MSTQYDNSDEALKTFKDFNVPMTLGATNDRGTVSTFLQGALDEVRISFGPRSADWVKLSYENQRPGQTLVTFD